MAQESIQSDIRGLFKNSKWLNEHLIGIDSAITDSQELPMDITKYVVMHIFIFFPLCLPLFLSSSLLPYFIEKQFSLKWSIYLFLLT